MTAAAVPHATQHSFGEAGAGRLAELADRLEVSGLVHRLAAALDEHRYDDVGALFVEEGSVRTPGGAAQGRAAVVEQARRNHTVYARMQHRMTDVLVGFDGAGASVRANAAIRLMADGTGPGLPTRTLGAVYRCRAVRAPDAWRLLAVEIEHLWQIDGP